MSRAEEIVGVRYSEMNEKQKRIYHNTLRNESHRRNKDKVKEQNRKYREQKKDYITKIENKNKILEKALELACKELYSDDNEGYCKTPTAVYKTDCEFNGECTKCKLRYFKQQAEKELRDE